MIKKLHVSTTMVVPALVVMKTIVRAVFLQELHSHSTGSVKERRFRTYQIGLHYLNSHLTKLLTYFSGSIQTKRATSSATVSHNQLEIPINRNAVDQPRLHEPPRPPASKMRKTISWICGICQKSHRSLQMIRCETCEIWFHKTCVYSSRDPKHMFFSTPTGLEDSWVICSKCLDQQNDHVSDAIAEYVNTLERLKRRVSSKEDRWHEPCIQVDFSSQTVEDQQEILPQEDEYLGLTRLTGTDFELAREEKFQGFDKSILDDLIQRLDQSMYDYNKEINDVVERFGDSDDSYIKKPLAEWKLVDAGGNFVAGHPWYHLDYPTKKISGSHLPITAALRCMLQSPDDKPLEIDPNLGSLSLFQVHYGFVGWFVIDVLSNEIDIYELPNMKPMRAMMAAVKDFADSSKFV